MIKFLITTFFFADLTFSAYIDKDFNNVFRSDGSEKKDDSDSDKEEEDDSPEKEMIKKIREVEKIIKEKKEK